MAEIKSSIEIAMEKTKGLVLSREEMKKIREEEMRGKAQSLVHRFLEVDFHLREVEKELAKLDPDQRNQLEKLIIENLSAALDLDRDNELIFQGLEYLRKESSPLLRQIKDLLKDYQEQKEKAFQETANSILKNLENKGISGSAVEPKVMESQEWAQSLAKFRPPLEMKLKHFQEELKKL